MFIDRNWWNKLRNNSLRRALVKVFFSTYRLVHTTDVEAEVEAGSSFLWKRKHFDETGWKRKRKCWKGAGSGSNFFKIRRFRIFNLATTVGVKCYNDNNIESTTRAWYGMERKFRYGIWKTPEWNERFQEWNGRQSFILPYQIHTRFCALYLQKNTYRCRVVIKNIVTKVFNLNIYG